MNAPPIVEIKIDEAFEHLPRAPIVEAVIDIRGRAQAHWDESTAKLQVEPKLPNYAFLDSQREFETEVKVRPDQPPQQVVRDLGWKGVRFQSPDKLHIAQFNRNGFVFSRLEPYENWEQLYDENQRLWNMFKELAQPVEIQRIGLRYINRIKLPVGELRFEDYIQPAPESPRGLDLPFHGFMHHDTLAVPGHPYAINVIRTIQPPQGASGSGVALILDIDVFTAQAFELDDTLLASRLLEMRWLKNKVFFGSITEKARETFR